MTEHRFEAVVTNHDDDENWCVPVSIPAGTTVTITWDDEVPPLDVIRRYLMRAPTQGEWPLEEHCDGLAGGIMLDLAEAGYEIVKRRPEVVDREPQPSDGPDYHADHAAWEERQRHPIVERRSF